MKNQIVLIRLKHLITAMIVKITGSCFSSTLSVVAALALDDVSIECSLTVFGPDPILIGDERLSLVANGTFLMFKCVHAE